MWPFKYINGDQTPESEALEGDKSQHKPEQPNIDDKIEALIEEERKLNHEIKH